jgi:hypothetical protein
MKNIFQFLLFSVIALTLLAVPALCADRTDDIFTSAKDTRDDMAKYRDLLNEGLQESVGFKDAMGTLRQRIEGSDKLSEGQKLIYLKSADELEGRVRKQISNLTRVKDKLKPLETALDAATVLYELKTSQESYDGGGPLQQSLLVLAKAMEKHGEKLPAGMDTMIANYGKVTGQMIAATRRLEKRINENIDQGIIGPGTHAHIFSAKKQKAAKVAGAGATLVPVIPDLLYRIEDTRDKGLIWDEGVQDWYAVDSADETRKIYSLALLAGKRLSPSQLHYLAAHPDAVKQMRQRAEGIAKALYLVARARQAERLDDAIYKEVFVGACDPEVYGELQSSGIDPVMSTLGERFIARCMFDVDSAQKNPDAGGRFFSLARESVIEAHKRILAKLRLALKNDPTKLTGTAVELHDIALRMPYWADQAGIKLERIVKLIVRVDPAVPLRKGEVMKTVITVSAGAAKVAQAATTERAVVFYAMPWKPYRVSAAAEGFGEAQAPVKPAGANPVCSVRLILGETAGSVELTVKDAVSKKPVDKAAVKLSGPEKFSGQSAGGASRFPKVFPGKYKLSVAAPGYEPYTRTIQIGIREAYAGNVWLTPAVQIVYEGTGTAERAVGSGAQFREAPSTARQGARIVVELRPDGTVRGTIYRKGWYHSVGTLRSSVEVGSFDNDEIITGTYAGGKVTGKIENPNLETVRDFSATYTADRFTLKSAAGGRESGYSWRDSYVFENIPKKR